MTGNIKRVMRRKSMLKRVCSWCSKTMGYKYMGYKDGGEGVTHGICPECYAKVLDEIESRP